MIELNWRKCFCRTFCTIKFPCDYSYFSVFKRHFWNIFFRDRLISWFSHFVCGWQIYPKLNHMLCSAFFGKIFTHIFIVHKARSCRHPLYIVSKNNPMIASRIIVLNLACIRDCYRFKTSMWMISNARTMTLALYRNFLWRIIIHHQKRTCLGRHFTTIT